jgi:ubiquinone/menaquinone biosynthesis C-methylase UbiE
METQHPFEMSGLASLPAFDAPEWRVLFEQMEREQADFVKEEVRFRSGNYKWPTDPLHTWSRCWEYPYTYYHLQKWRNHWLGSGLPKVVDLGSGVTYFPFSVARLRCDVSCTDITPVCGTELDAASRFVSCKPGTVNFRLTDGAKLPYGDGEVDAIYCVSVLEHIPSFETTIAEMARVLKPQGLLLLTIDLDLRGDNEIGAERYRALKREVESHFRYVNATQTAHPAALLTSANGPFPVKEPRGISRFYFSAKQLAKAVLNRPTNPLTPFHLCVEGMSLQKP